MKRLLEEAFDQGAFGFSSGLIYAPGIFSRTEELIELTKTVKRYGRPYVSHIRGETDMVRESVEEAIRIGRAAGVPTHISHHKVAGKANWGRTAETLAVIAAALAQGTDVSVDVYPYTSGSTALYAILPRWVQDGGAQKMLERLGEDAVRHRVKSEFVASSPGWENLQKAAGWEGIRIANCPGRPELEGHSLSELAPRREDDFVFDLLIEEHGNVTMIIDLMAEGDVRNVLGFERAMIGSDGIPIPGKPHPRWAGTFARVLGHYAREQRLLDLPMAVKKMMR